MWHQKLTRIVPQKGGRRIDDLSIPTAAVIKNQVVFLFLTFLFQDVKTIEKESRLEVGEKSLARGGDRGPVWWRVEVEILHGTECLFQIANDILGLLETNRKPDSPRIDSAFELLFRGNT